MYIKHQSLDTNKSLTGKKHISNNSLINFTNSVIPLSLAMNRTNDDFFREKENEGAFKK